MAFGLDISDLSIKIINLKKREGHLTLVNYGIKKIPIGVIEKGEIKKEDDLVKILKDFFKNDIKGGRLNIKDVAASLPEENAFFRVIQLPIVKKAEVEQAIKYQLESYIPHKIEDIYYDFQVIHPPKDHEKHTNVLIAALPRAIVDSYLSVFKKIGVRPVVLEIESQALVRSLVKNSQSMHPLLIIDMGATGSSFTLFSGNTILFTSHIPISGQDITNVIAKGMEVDKKKAEDLKKKVGFQYFGKAKKSKKKEDQKVYECLVPVLTDLKEQIKKFLDFYAEHGKVEYAPDGHLAKIILCGGDSLLKGLPEFLSESLGFAVEVGNPWINVSQEKPEISSEILKYTTAIGLALRSVNEQ